MKTVYAFTGSQRVVIFSKVVHEAKTVRKIGNQAALEVVGGKYPELFIYIDAAQSAVKVAGGRFQ